jgi:broad specificity phosphatase PhoE
MKVYLIRHAKTRELSDEEPLKSARDFPLVEEGRDQVDKLVNRFYSEGVIFDELYTSPCAHAQETTRGLIRLMNASQATFAVDDRLNKNHHGRWENEPFTVYTPSVARAMDADPYEWKAHGGDSLKDIELRMWEFLRGCQEGSQKRKIGVVTHGLPIKIATCSLRHGNYLRAKRQKVANTAVTLLQYSPKTDWKLVYFASRNHLKD